MNTIEQVTRIAGREPCSGACEWLVTQSDVQTAWRNCERADWLLWFAEYGGVGRAELALAACDCAETALAHVPGGEDRPRVAIETARAWARGEATLAEVRRAAAAAHAAAAAAADAAAAAAADAAHAAADAAHAAAYAAHAYAAAYAAHAADAAADAAYAADAYAYAADADARHTAHATMCALIRKRWPECPVGSDT